MLSRGPAAAWYALRSSSHRARPGRSERPCGAGRRSHRATGAHPRVGTHHSGTRGPAVGMKKRYPAMTYSPAPLPGQYHRR